MRTEFQFSYVGAFSVDVRSPRFAQRCTSTAAFFVDECTRVGVLVKIQMHQFKVLLVDDYEPFCKLARSILQRNTNIQVVGQVSDGLEAVQKAAELCPDLIVLDIGLPTLNGIEAARRIREVSPGSKILFLSQESSADAVNEALSLGARGYVVKAHAGSELLSAVEAVLQGHRFVGGRLSVNNFTDVETQASERLKEVAPPSLPLRNRESTRGHTVRFHSDDASLLADFTSFIEANLTAGNAVIVVATESHRTSLLQKLEAHGVDCAAAIEHGRYIPLDVGETLSTFMVNDLPDPVRFSKVAGELFEAAAKAVKAEHARVAACGECAPSLWAQGKAEAAVQLEHLWDEVAKKYDVDVLCGYVLKSFQREQESQVYERICAEHLTILL
jgi:DNA-binding NarL/FixJ family response regulator